MTGVTEVIYQQRGIACFEGPKDLEKGLQRREKAAKYTYSFQLGIDMCEHLKGNRQTSFGKRL